MTCDLTTQELSHYAAGETVPARAAEIDRHLADCAVCREQLASLRTVDELLGALPRAEPPADVTLRVRRALTEQTRGGGGTSEIMTLAEVAEFLRVGEAELEQILPELPAFELAGQVRVRRPRLLDWVQQREQAYTKSNMASLVARDLTGRNKENVA